MLRMADVQCTVVWCNYIFTKVTRVCVAHTHAHTHTHTHTHIHTHIHTHTQTNGLERRHSYMLPTMVAMHTQYTVDHGCLQYCSVACERVKFMLVECVVDNKSLNGLGKESGFSIEHVAQYCSVARERVNQALKTQISHKYFRHATV